MEGNDNLNIQKINNNIESLVMRIKVIIWKWTIVLFFMSIFIWSIYSGIEFLQERKNQKRTLYIKDCIEGLERFEYSETEKECICSCGHDYLFNKYGKIIYNEYFVMPTREDSLEAVNCFMNCLKIKDIDKETLLE